MSFDLGLLRLCKGIELLPVVVSAQLHFYWEDEIVIWTTFYYILSGEIRNIQECQIVETLEICNLAESDSKLPAHFLLDRNTFISKIVWVQNSSQGSASIIVYDFTKQEVKNDSKPCKNK
jgi:hypothetical protein